MSDLKCQSSLKSSSYCCWAKVETQSFTNIPFSFWVFKGKLKLQHHWKAKNEAKYLEIFLPKMLLFFQNFHFLMGNCSSEVIISGWFRTASLMCTVLWVNEVLYCSSPLLNFFFSQLSAFFLPVLLGLFFFP